MTVDGSFRALPPTSHELASKSAKDTRAKCQLLLPEGVS